MMIRSANGAQVSAAGNTADDAAVSGNDLPDLIPVRMLNEFTYCPRLGSLEWVHSEWADNFETKGGTFGHRRVDQPDSKAIPRPADGTLTSRPANPPANGGDTAATNTAVPAIGDGAPRMARRTTGSHRP